MNARRSILLMVFLLLAVPQDSRADTPAGPRPLPLLLGRLILPEVKFRDADLSGALGYMRRKAEVSSAGKWRVPFVLDLPEDFQPRFELSLDLKAVPFAEALRYLGEQAGVEFSAEDGVVYVRRLGTASAAHAAAQKGKKAFPASTAPTRGLAGPLAKAPEAVTGGNNVHRSTAGEVQADRSGYIPRRNLGGWSVEKDSRNATGVNCVRPEKCPGGDCGCFACACRKRTPSPPKP